MFRLEGNLWICLICTLTKPEHNIHLRIDLSMKQKISNQGYTAGRRPECLLCHRDAAFGVQVGRNSLRRKSEQQSWPRSLPSSEARAAGVGRRCETDVIHRPPLPAPTWPAVQSCSCFPQQQSDGGCKTVKSFSLAFDGPLEICALAASFSVDSAPAAVSTVLFPSTKKRGITGKLGQLSISAARVASSTSSTQ